MNGLSNLDETYRVYSLAPTDDVIKSLEVKGQRSKSQQAVAKASTSTLGRRSTLYCFVHIPIDLFLPRPAIGDDT